MKAVWQAMPEVIEKYARTDIRHFKEARLGQQTSSGQGESLEPNRRAGRLEFPG
jgi:hypothetical protein